MSPSLTMPKSKTALATAAAALSDKLKRSDILAKEGRLSLIWFVKVRFVASVEVDGRNSVSICEVGLPLATTITSELDWLFSSESVDEASKSMR